jgi:hypothetical protein
MSDVVGRREHATIAIHKKVSQAPSWWHGSSGLWLSHLRNEFSFACGFGYASRP